MTYRQLRLLLDGLNDEQLNDDITVYLSEMDEYFAVALIYPAGEHDENKAYNMIKEMVEDYEKKTGIPIGFSVAYTKYEYEGEEDGL